MPRRAIDTSIWNDDRFAAASPEAKLIYVRLITGDDTGPAGASRVHSRRLAADTGLSTRRSEACLEELVGAGLVRRYEGGWLWLPAWIRYQVAGPGFCKAVRRQAKDCPDSLAKAISRALDDHAPRSSPDRTPTGKGATSRDDRDPPPTPLVRDPEGTRDPLGGGTGPGPMPPSGANGSVWDSSAVAGAGGASSAVPGEGKPSHALSLDEIADLAPDSETMGKLRRLRGVGR